MRPDMRHGHAILAMLFCIVAASSSLAHELRPATLLLTEIGGGRVRFQWNPPRALPGDARRIYPEFPAGCRVVSARRLHCDGEELTGRLRIHGLRGRRIEVFVQVLDATGSRRVRVLNAREPEMELGGERTGSPVTVVVPAYLKIGVEHILGGFDHLLFVLGLLLVVGMNRRLVWTVTAFTLAHSITLALAVLDLVRVDPAAVEATIALSIVLVASEALTSRETLTRRFPWAVALAFGLLHGLGFAGALREVGLPEGQMPLALLSFNGGVEIGQLAVIGACYLIGRRLRGRLSTPLPRRVAAYAIGSLASYWLMVRLPAIFS